jgi:alpha-L-rhamnosidase
VPAAERESTWQARLVTGPESHAAAGRPAPYFRREFDARRDLRRATLHVTALGVVEAHLNGAVVGDEVLCPGWTSYAHRLVVSTHDVTGLVVPGRNAIGAIVGEGWAVGRLAERGRRNIWSDRPAVFVQLELEYDDDTVVVATDETWRTSAGAVLADGIYDGETHDARLEPHGWDRAGYADDTWHAVSVSERDLGSLVPRTAPPIRRTEELRARAITTSPSGLTVIDFGQVLSGWVRIAVNGPAGTTVTLRHAEVLVDGEPEFETNRTAEATDRYTLAGGGPEMWEPRFTFHGFRYVVVEGWPGELSLADITAVVVHSDMTRTGWFETSDERVNQLHRNVVWSWRGNAVGLPTDCPQRDERLGWTGDINAFGSTAAFLYDVRTFLGSWLQDLAAEQRELGVVPWVVPDVLGLATGPTALWGDVAVSLPWTLYQEYGDAELLATQYPSMRAFVDSVVPMLDDDGLWSKGFQFGDWLDPDAPAKQPSKAKAETSLVATAYFCRVTDELARAAVVLGEDADEKRYRALHDSVRAAFRREWVTPSGRLSNEAPTTYALAICFALLDPTQEARAGERLARLVRESGHHIKSGFAGTPWLAHALTRTGHLEDAYRLLLQTTPPSFLYPVTMGATTIWERWDAILPDGKVHATGMTSLNHYAFGAIADWLHRVVGGLSAVGPGYRQMRIAPQPGGGLTWASVTHDTVHGRVRVAWRDLGGVRTVEVVIPMGTVAEVILPGHPEGLVETVGGGDHEWRYDAPATPRYTLSTPFDVLRADPPVWQAVGAVLGRLYPGVDNLIDYVAESAPDLATALRGLSASRELEQDLLAAITS